MLCGSKQTAGDLFIKHAYQNQAYIRQRREQRQEAENHRKQAVYSYKSEIKCEFPYASHLITASTQRAPGPCLKLCPVYICLNAPAMPSAAANGLLKLFIIDVWDN